MLIPLGGHQDLLGGTGFSNASVAKAIGLGDWIDNDERDFDAAVIRKQMHALHRTAEAAVDGLLPPPPLAANMERLAMLVGLSDTDCRILEFTTIMHHDRVLNDDADTLGHCPR